MAERPRGFEYKHVECPQIPALVDVVTNDHAKFYWELTGTQTVVAKESHLESGEYNSDNLYSVITTERFVALDFKRGTDIPQFQRIKQVETNYFQICASLRNLGGSPLDAYGMPDFSFNLLEAFILPLFNPGYYFWTMTYGPFRDIKKTGIAGFLWSPYGYWKVKHGHHGLEEKARQFNSLKAELQHLLDSNKEILNV
jgi:hypothetical protein